MYIKPLAQMPSQISDISTKVATEQYRAYCLTAPSYIQPLLTYLLITKICLLSEVLGYHTCLLSYITHSIRSHYVDGNQ